MPISQKEYMEKMRENDKRVNERLEHEEALSFYKVKVTNLEERLRLAESEKEWYKAQLASCAHDKKRLEKYSAENKELLDSLIAYISSTGKE